MQNQNEKWEEELEKIIQNYGNKIYAWYPKKIDTESVDEIKDFIRNLITQTRKQDREAMREEIGKFTVYYRSKFSNDCSREETEKEKSTEMVELTNLLSFIDGLE